MRSHGRWAFGRLGEHDELLHDLGTAEEARVDPFDARAEPLELPERRLDDGGDAWVERYLVEEMRDDADP